MAVLSGAARAAGHSLDHVAQIGSTNAEALARASRGERGPLWILADRQIAGRGRRGRDWVSPLGNLYATLLLVDPAPPALTPQLSFVAALALDDAILTLAPELQERLALKWPNDLLVDGAKLSGILVEGSTQGTLSAVVIGMGVNIVSHPEGMAYATTSLDAAGASVSRDDLFEVLTASMTRALALWHRGERFDLIRAGWLARAAGLGHPMIVRGDGDRLEGIFAGLAPDGRLILDTPDGRRLVTSGDAALSFGRVQ